MRVLAISSVEPIPYRHDPMRDLLTESRFDVGLLNLGEYPIQ